MFAERLEPEEVSPKILEEMLKVGAVPIEGLESYGDIETIGSKQIKYGEEISRKEFFDKVIGAGLEVWQFSNLPAFLKFQVVTEVK